MPTRRRYVSQPVQGAVNAEAEADSQDDAMDSETRRNQRHQHDCKDKYLANPLINFIIAGFSADCKKI